MDYLAGSAQINQQITKIILLSPDSQTLLSRLAKVIGELFHVDTCLVVALPKKAAITKIGLWHADDHVNPECTRQAQLSVNSILKDDCVGAKPLAIRDLRASTSDKVLGYFQSAFSTRAVMKIYSRFQSAVNGMIILGRKQPYKWTRLEQELLATVAESVAIAISQVQLNQQLFAAECYQNLFKSLSRQMSSNRPLPEILQLATKATAITLQADRGLLLLLKNITIPSESIPSQQLLEIEVRVVCDWWEESDDDCVKLNSGFSKLINQSFWLSDCALCQQAFINTPEPIVIAEGQDRSNFELISQSSPIFAWEMMPSGVIFPLVKSHQHRQQEFSVLGFLVLQHCHDHSWQAEQLDWLKCITTQISTIITHHQSLQQVQLLLEERTAQLQDSVELQEHLYQKNCRQVDQLEELNQLKEDFMSSMSHELRTPLTTMSLAIRMLRQAKLNPQRRQQYLEILEQQCNREIDLINDLLSLQQLETDSSQIQLQKIDLMLLIDKLAKSFRQQWVDKGLILSVESLTPSLMLETNYESLSRILMELLTNAGKHCERDTTVKLQVDCQAKESVNQIIVTLTNLGLGISPADLPYIFDKFRRGEDANQRAIQGTGLGLALVKCLVKQLNGTIIATESPTQEPGVVYTSFILNLPQFQS
ncbi:MAG: GAF domain-containing sensor histidine kinase [Symploca sp. SIO1C4]|uniref:histidine kinase n=1 Tax=Symploca sp. SIO1C4 TaxID=2607765 RepID=A0A6B3N6I5_9CYAN|nr:GAF domain-containing sensor histidine kinase [Symploca sp. SIO1C4]